MQAISLCYFHYKHGQTLLVTFTSLSLSLRLPTAGSKFLTFCGLIECDPLERGDYPDSLQGRPKN